MITSRRWIVQYYEAPRPGPGILTTSDFKVLKTKIVRYKSPKDETTVRNGSFHGLDVRNCEPYDPTRKDN